MRFNSDGTSWLKMELPTAWTYHGWIMVGAWTGISVLQVITNRYMLHFYKLHQPLHTLLGLLSLSATLYGAVLAF